MHMNMRIQLIFYYEGNTQKDYVGYDTLTSDIYKYRAK